MEEEEESWESMSGWLLVGRLFGKLSVVSSCSAVVGWIIGRKPFIVIGWFEISFSDSIGFPPTLTGEEDCEQRPGKAFEQENPSGQEEHCWPALYIGAPIKFPDGP